MKLEYLPRSNVRSKIVHVFDGELVQDKSEDGVKFLIFDALVVNGVNVMSYTFTNRLRIVQKDIIKKLRIKEFLELNKPHLDDNYNDSYDNEFDDVNNVFENSSATIKVFLKDFYRDADVKTVFNNIIPKLDHGNDGVIFTLDACPYYPGTCQEIIKWKPPSLNSVDFILKKITSYSNEDYVWGLYARTFDTPELLYDCIFFKGAEENNEWDSAAKVAMQNNKPIIAECTFVPDLEIDNLIRFNLYKRFEQTTDYPKEEAIKKNFKFDREIMPSHRTQLKGGWVIERQRTDKTTPNSLNVAENIKKTIVDPLTIEDLVKHSDGFEVKYVKSGMYRPPETMQNGSHKMQKTSE